MAKNMPRTCVTNGTRQKKIETVFVHGIQSSGKCKNDKAKTKK